MFLTALVLRQKLLSLTLSHSHTNNCFLRALNYQAIKHYEEGKKQLLKIPKVFFFYHHHRRRRREVEMSERRSKY